MIDLSIDQAVFEGEQLLARSANFADAWQPVAVALLRGFGVPPSGSSSDDALFVRAFGPALVAVVRVAWPRFHFIVLGRELYDHLHDPFAIAERFPPDWNARGSLPDLTWPSEPLPRRTIAMLDAILKHGDGPFLLGAAQLLVDGGKVVLQRAAPEPKLLRDLWALLPDSVRRSTSLATFAFGNDLGFDLLALHTIPEGGLYGYLNEEQVLDYPDSRYERYLQVAIESGDQAALDRLLTRKSANEMIRAVLLVIGLGVGAIVAVRVLSVLGVI